MGQLVSSFNPDVVTHSKILLPVWELDSPHPEVHAVHAMDVSPDGNLLAAAGECEGMILLWSLVLDDIIVRLHEHLSSVFALRFSPSSDQLLSASGDGTIRLWAVPVGDLKFVYRIAPNLWHWSLAWGDDSLFAVGSLDATISVWSSYHADSAMSVWKGHDKGVSAVVFVPSLLPDEDRLSPEEGGTHQAREERIGGQPAILASASADGSIGVWHWEAKLLLWRLRGHLGNVTSIDFFPMIVVSGGEDGTIRTWGLFDKFHEETERVARLPRLPRMLNEETVASSLPPAEPKKKDLADEKAESMVFRGHNAPVVGVRACPFWELLASSDTVGVVRIWKISEKLNLLPLLKFETGGYWTRNVCFGPRRENLYTAGADGFVHVWNTAARIRLPEKEAKKKRRQILWRRRSTAYLTDWD